MNQCRLCGAPLSKPFLNLGNTPISNCFLTEYQIHEPELYYPLEVYFCNRCSLIQIDVYEVPEQIFNEDYAYHSSYSESWLQHSQDYVAMMEKRFAFKDVLEIGSNDGYLLQYFKEKGFSVQGVEPSGCAKIAIEKGIPTDQVFFNCLYANKYNADLIIANNVLAHNPDLNGFVSAIKQALNQDGIVTVEFPHVLQLVQNNQFDTIYHEHYSYLSFHAVKILFNKHGLDIFDVEEMPTHGGSLRVYARHKQVRTKPPQSVLKIEKKEVSAGLLNEETYMDFGKNVIALKRNLLSLLIKLKEEGNRVVGYGAPAKGNTLLNYCGIRTDFLDYVVDKDPKKQGRYLPGTHIPIYNPSRILADKPDYILILPWNLKEEIISQLIYARAWGGKFIVPIPNVKVIL